MIVPTRHPAVGAALCAVGVFAALLPSARANASTEPGAKCTSEQLHTIVTAMSGGSVRCVASGSSFVWTVAGSATQATMAPMPGMAPKAAPANTPKASSAKAGVAKAAPANTPKASSAKAGVAKAAVVKTLKAGTKCTKSQLNKTAVSSSGVSMQCVLVGKSYVWSAVVATTMAPMAMAPSTTVAPRILYSTDFYRLDEWPDTKTVNGTVGHFDEKYQMEATNSTGIQVAIPVVVNAMDVAMTMKYRVLSGTPAVFLTCYDTPNSWLYAGIREGSTRSYEIWSATPAGATKLASGSLPLELQTANQIQPLTIGCAGTPGQPGLVTIRYALNTVGQALVPVMPPAGRLSMYVSGPARVQFDNLVVAG